ncbi:MAG: hypothetical protein AAFN77_00195 [Planctomycetota bacterium]
MLNNNTAVHRLLSKMSTLLLASFVACFAGCQQNPVPTTSVSVQVTIDDEPLADARVVMVPGINGDNGVRYPIAFGLTDEQGKCVLQTTDGSNQLATLRYDVFVSKPVEMKQSPLVIYQGTALEKLIGETEMSMFEQHADVVPMTYNRFSTISVDVEANQFPFELTLELESRSP